MIPENGRLIKIWTEDTRSCQANGVFIDGMFYIRTVLGHFVPARIVWDECKKWEYYV